MLLTPQITLTATLQDFCGNAAGTAANPAKLRIALVGYGPVLPCIAATSNIAQVGPWYYYSTGEEISIKLWGNDVITPAGTYYEIAIIDGDGNMVQCGAYQFTGTQTIDLSSAVQVVPPYGFQVGLLKYAACTGATPGSVFTAPGQVIMAFVMGVPQRPTIDYTVGSGNVITFNFTVRAGNNVYALCVVV